MTSDKEQSDTATVLEAIAAMPEPDRIIGERLHAIITATAPELLPRTWYGMPAYTIKTASKGYKILCFFRSGKKFGERYMTFGFNDVANLDEGAMWPISYALTELTAADEARVIEMVKKAIG